MRKFTFSRIIQVGKKTFADNFKNNKNNGEYRKLGDEFDRQQDRQEGGSMFSGLGDKISDIKNKVTETLGSAAEKIGLNRKNNVEGQGGSSSSSAGKSEKSNMNEESCAKEGENHGKSNSGTPKGEPGNFTCEKKGTKEGESIVKNESTAQYSSRPSGEYGSTGKSGNSGGISEQGRSNPFQGSQGGTQGGVYGGTGHSGGAYGGTSDKPYGEGLSHGSSGSDADSSYLKGTHGSSGGASTKSTGSGTIGTGTTSTRNDDLRDKGFSGDKDDKDNTRF